MPTKHKRKGDLPASQHDLPPTTHASPLPPSIHKKSDPIFTSEIEKKRKFEARRQKKRDQRQLQNRTQKQSEYKDDDTPKAFKRLMAFQEGKRVRNGLDDGTNTSKKRKRTSAAEEVNQTKKTSGSEPTTVGPSAKDDDIDTSTQPIALKIQPQESLSNFALRVDQSLPLNTIPKHNSKLPTSTLPVKNPLTKHNKRLARMQKDWRATETRLRAKEEDTADDLADKKEEDTLLWLGAGVDPSNPLRGAKKRKKAGKGRDVDDVDPWKVLEKKRREEGVLRQNGLQDVVVAPPVLKPLKNMFKLKPESHGGSQYRGREAITT